MAKKEGKRDMWSESKIDCLIDNFVKNKVDVQQPHLLSLNIYLSPVTGHSFIRPHYQCYLGHGDRGVRAHYQSDKHGKSNVQPQTMVTMVKKKWHNLILYARKDIELHRKHSTDSGKIPTPN